MLDSAPRRQALGLACFAFRLSCAARTVATPIGPAAPPSHAYIVESLTDEQPILAHTSFSAGPRNSDWQQVFNPTWVQASPSTGNRSGLLVRSQNCKLLADDDAAPCPDVLTPVLFPTSRHTTPPQRTRFLRSHLRWHWSARLLAHLGSACRRWWCCIKALSSEPCHVSCS
eukprot:SAG31_NODE_518_length_14674_cov_39.604803_5_plen_171_part_00